MIGQQPSATIRLGRLPGSQASPRRIGSWARYGIVPRVSQRPSVYSSADAGEAVIVRYLIEQGAKPKKIREMVERLRDRFGAWPLARAPLEHEGGLVVMREGDRVLVDVIDRPDQQVEEGTFLSLTAVRSALERGGWVAFANPGTTSKLTLSVCRVARLSVTGVCRRPWLPSLPTEMKAARYSARNSD